MSVEQKIDAFIQGITCSTTQNIIVSLAGDATIRDTFEDYNNAVACHLELALSFANKPASREICTISEITKKPTPSKKQKLVDTTNTASFVP